MSSLGYRSTMSSGTTSILNGAVGGMLTKGGMGIVSTDIAADRVIGRGVNDLHEDAFEEFYATVYTFTRFPELRIKSQYAHEIAPSVGTHN